MLFSGLGFTPQFPREQGHVYFRYVIDTVFELIIILEVEYDQWFLPGSGQGRGCNKSPGHIM